MVTDHEDNVLMEQEKIPGYTGMSPYVIFNKDIGSAPVVISQDLHVWYNEDFRNEYESDNSGSHTVRVYATFADASE